jgi:hypothetical protein
MNLCCKFHNIILNNDKMTAKTMSDTVAAVLPLGLMVAILDFGSHIGFS